MGSITVRVDGLKELQKAMQSLGRKTSNRIAVKAMRKGGAIVRDKARSLAPVLKESVPHRRAGTLRKSIQSRTKVGKNGRTDAYIWVKGLSTKQVLKFKEKSGKSSAYNPRTSKMPARPFMRPAFQQSKEQAAQAIIDTLQQEIIAEASK